MNAKCSESMPALQEAAGDGAIGGQQ